MTLLWVTIPLALAAIAIWVMARRSTRRPLVTPRELGRLLDGAPVSRGRAGPGGPPAGLPDGERKPTLVR
jgi:hypothetical protein